VNLGHCLKDTKSPDGSLANAEDTPTTPHNKNTTNTGAEHLMPVKRTPLFSNIRLYLSSPC
jgi:hypothetical protein